MMSFKKPKRNLRVRENKDDDSENEATDSNNVTAAVDKPVKKPKKPVTQSLLSFEEDLNEGDDGEVFKVKKSNQSKKIKKQLEKERKKKKEKTDGNSLNNSEKQQSQHALDDDIIIKLKNTFPVLNGREAEATTVGGVSSEEDESESNAPRFIKQTDSVKLLLKRGTIPDAAAIHAARKQRQHIREMGENYTAPEDTPVNDTKSRLIREDDNDASDGEEERINMTVNTAIEDRLRRKAEFDAAQERGSTDSDKGEDDEWEAQQIRKGVTGAQIAAVQQENYYYQQYLGNGLGMAMGAAPEIQGVVDQMPVEQSYMVFPPLPSTGAIDPQEVIKKLKDRLTDLNEVHRRHKQDMLSGSEEIESLKNECIRIKEEGPKRAERFRFYQDLRGYVTDLVECLDEKIVIVNLLEERVISMYSRKVAEYVSRRRQDVMDQAQELAPTPQRRIDRDEATIRRVAEREGRRIRRQRVRELKGIQGHMEGMSSDEEVTEAEAVAMRSQRDVIEQDARHVFEDVIDEFGTVRGILKRFETWRREDMDAYSEAYVSLCLPKLIGPLIRLKLVLWNPIIQVGMDFEKSLWYNSLLLYGSDEYETEERLRKDPDNLLIPRVVEQVILRKLTQLVKECWDPLSSSQTVLLVALVTKILQDYPTLTHKSKCVTTFFEAVLEKMKESVENDVYIPIYPQQRMTEGKVSNFFMRQCTVAVKLLGNLTRWQGVISDSVLSEIALTSLLNRSLLMAIRTCNTMQAANICQMVGNVLPRIWLQVCVHPPQLTQFLNQAKLTAKALDVDKPFERDALERMSGVLKAAAGV